MDSEVTNLADLKAFDPADYATAAQGALADSAQHVLTEGAFVDGDKTKLDGIEAGAQVTDATSVEAAGALMDSEVTNLADLKAFDPADYATAAQGALADSALQASNNLSDVSNVISARNSLGIYSGVITFTINGTSDFVALTDIDNNLSGIITDTSTVIITSNHPGLGIQTVLKSKSPGSSDYDRLQIFFYENPNSEINLSYIIIP